MEEFLVLLKDHYDLSKLSELFIGIIKSLTIHYLCEIFSNNKIEININPRGEKDINYEIVYLLYPLINYYNFNSYCKVSLDSDCIPQFHVFISHKHIPEFQILPNSIYKSVLGEYNNSNKSILKHPIKSSLLVPSILTMYRDGVQLAKAKMIYFCQSLYKDKLKIVNMTEKKENNLYHIESKFNGEVFSKLFQDDMLIVIQKAGNWIVKMKWKNNISPINCGSYLTLQTKSHVQISSESILLKYHYYITFPEFIEDVSSFSKNKQFWDYSNSSETILRICDSSILDFNGLTFNVKCQSCNNVYFIIIIILFYQ